MKPRNKLQSAHGITRREGLLALVGSVAVLSGCGGGGGSTASVTSGGTGSFSGGAITGFGSIIVNGVRFDDSQARITDDDGNLHGSADLKLGMVVTVTGSGITAGAASAGSVLFGSELRGPIDSISVGSQSLEVLGQTVRITASTVFEDGISGGIAGLSVGQLVEVHGFVDPSSNTIFATRIERASSLSSFKLQGQVQALNTTAKTFMIGSLTISYASVAELPAGLANGLLVRVRLATSPATGTRTALSVRAVTWQVEDHDEAELEGTVTAFTSTSNFSVNGLPVDASRASFPDGTAGLQLGARVEVEGSLSHGVLIATKVELETQSKVDTLVFDLHGAISGLNTASQTFVLRGVTVSYAGVLVYENGDASRLANGVTVEVRGNYSAAIPGISATKISF